MSELKWNWVYYPYLDAPNEQKESALKAGYIKVVDKSEADKVIAHHKYKRCLAMVQYCHESAMWLEENGVGKSAVFMLRWEKRWMELAKVFKEEK